MKKLILMLIVGSMFAQDDNADSSDELILYYNHIKFTYLIKD